MELIAGKQVVRTLCLFCRSITSTLSQKPLSSQNELEVGLDCPEVAAMDELQLDVLAEQPRQEDRQVGKNLAQRQHLRPQRLAARGRRDGS